MVRKLTRDEILALSPSERLDLISDIWDTLENNLDDLPLSDELRQRLRQRYEEFLASPDEGSSWEEVEARLRKRLR